MRKFEDPVEQRVYNDGFEYGREHAATQATELHGQSPEQATELYDRTGTGDEAWYEHFEENPMSGEWAGGPSMRDLFSPEEYAQLDPEEEQDLFYIWREGYDDGLVAGVQTLAEPLGRMDDPGGTYLPEGWTSAYIGDRGIPFERLAKFILQADWNDVMAKAKRLVQEGKVTILNNTPQSVISQVIGDGSDNDGEPDTHQVELAREDPDSNVLTQTVCDCAYNQFRWDRTREWKGQEGRPCSHILATYWKSKSTPIDSESVPTGYQAPVGQKGPVTAPGQQKIPGMGQPAQPPSPQTQQPQLPSTQQMVTPPQPTNPFNPPKQPGGGGAGGAPKPPVPQRQQLDLFSVNPSSAGPAGDPAGGVSVPGGTPPTPENPVNIPGTFSSWREATADWREKYHLREAENQAKSCATCSAFKGDGTGKCQMFNDAKVDEHQTCDAWSDTWRKKSTVSVIPVKTTTWFRTAADDLLNHFDEQQSLGQPIYVALKKPQDLELRGGKIPIPGAQPYDVSTEGVPMYSMMDLGWNPQTQQRETSHPEETQGAPEHRGVYVNVPSNKHAEVRDWDPEMEWALVHSPLHYPGGEDARLHPHSAVGWVPFNQLRAVKRPRSPFRKR